MSCRALEGAERKGRQARLAGVARDACPYPDWRKADGRLTFSRAFRNAWRNGWDAADRGAPGPTPRRGRPPATRRGRPPAPRLRLSALPALIAHGATQRQILALLQAFQLAGIYPRPAGSGRWARWAYTPGLVLRLAIAWEVAHGMDMGLQAGLAAVRAAAAAGFLAGDACALPERVLLWLHPDRGWEPVPDHRAALVRSLAAGAGAIVHVTFAARRLALRAHAGGELPHANDPDEAPCRCRLEEVPAGALIRAVLDEHTAAACRDAADRPVAWLCEAAP